MDDEHKDLLIETEFNKKGKIDVSRFKGLGEMPPAQLKETAMSIDTRTLLRVTVPTTHNTEGETKMQLLSRLVEDLMGRRPELRLAFIQQNALNFDTKLLDV
jgi:topoisomerase-4 subunit B